MKKGAQKKKAQGKTRQSEGMKKLAIQPFFFFVFRIQQH